MGLFARYLESCERKLLLSTLDGTVRIVEGDYAGQFGDILAHYHTLFSTFYAVSIGLSCKVVIFTSSELEPVDEP